MSQPAEPAKAPTSHTTSLPMENSWAQKGQPTDKESACHALLGTRTLASGQPLSLKMGAFMLVFLKFTIRAALYYDVIIFFLQGQASTLTSLVECVNNLL